MTLIKDLPIDERIEWLLNLNTTHAEKFASEHLLRKQYRAQHPTEMAAFKCMDGRIHLPRITTSLLGIISPYRNMGGRFDLGWPVLGAEVEDWVTYSLEKGSDCLIFITYHFSAGDHHRGCAGFDYNTENALNAMIKFQKQFFRMFGENNGVVFPIIIGIETDRDALIFHGEDINRRYVPADDNIIDPSEALDALYPSMKDVVKNDLLPLINGNKKYVAGNKDRTVVSKQHNEWVIGIGKGFDWLHEPNTALIIGPYGYDSIDPIKTAVKVVRSNMDSGRTNNDGMLLLVSAPYAHKGKFLDKNRAREKSIFLTNFTKRIIRETDPVIFEKTRVISAIVDMDTRILEKIPEDMVNEIIF